MPLSRRTAIAALAAAPSAFAGTANTASAATSGTYGLIGKMRAQPGQRDALVAILAEGTQAMPGCLSYIIALDQHDPDALWITEVWDSILSHKASLALPSVRAAIAKGKPLIAGFGDRFETRPVAGVPVAAV